jgi:hypothetical protein
MPVGDSAGTLPLRVVQKERVEAGPGRFVDAVVVETRGLGGPLRLGVSKEPPYVFKTEETAIRDGVPWRIYTTLMLESQSR